MFNWGLVYDKKEIMNNEELKELLNAKFGEFTATIIGRYELQEQKMETMICHQKETNGRVNKHDMQINGLSNMQSEIVANLKHIRWARKHPVQAIVYVLAGIVLLIKVATLIPIEKIIPYIIK